MNRPSNRLESALMLTSYEYGMTHRAEGCSPGPVMPWENRT
jgi:hypothetical protein